MLNSPIICTTVNAILGMIYKKASLISECDPHFHPFSWHSVLYSHTLLFLFSALCFHIKLFSYATICFLSAAPYSYSALCFLLSDSVLFHMQLCLHMQICFHMILAAFTFISLLSYATSVSFISLLPYATLLSHSSLYFHMQPCFHVLLGEHLVMWALKCLSVIVSVCKSHPWDEMSQAHILPRDWITMTLILHENTRDISSSLLSNVR